jgi:hypothetical protein
MAPTLPAKPSRHADWPKIHHFDGFSTHLDRRLRGKSGELTNTEIIVPSKEDFAEWLIQNEKELDKIPPSTATFPSDIV